MFEKSGPSDNFGISGVNFIIFYYYIQKRSTEKVELKLRPPLKSVAALPYEKQVVNHTALQPSYSDQSDEKPFITVNIHEKMSFLCFSTQIDFCHVFKISAFGTYVFSVKNATGQ